MRQKILPGLIILSCLATDCLAGDRFFAARKAMVEEQIISRGVSDRRVISALLKVPRHQFVPFTHRDLSYADGPLPIGYDQTISQPYIVALMTELLELKGKEKVLEIGTGSGYQAAILAELTTEVYSIEIIKGLADGARKLLEEMGYDNISVRHGDGYLGWPDQAPFDAIIVTAAPAKIPPKLIEQLKEGGKMVLPVGTLFQQLKVVTKRRGKPVVKGNIAVRFVPMVGGN